MAVRLVEPLRLRTPYWEYFPWLHYDEPARPYRRTTIQSDERPAPIRVRWQHSYCDAMSVLRTRFLAGGLFALVMILLGAFIWTGQRDDGIRALKVEDYDTAMRKLRPLATLGDNTAQDLLGKMYAHGWGVKEDDDEALRWFGRIGCCSGAHANKVAIAALYVAKDYAEGVGVERNEAAAVRWLKIAAEKGSKDA